MPGTMNSYTIYDRPLDYPTHFVVRRYVISAGECAPTEDMSLFASLDEARAAIPPNLICMPRDPSDHRSVVETWM